MKLNTFKTLKQIASQNLKKLSLTFSLVMAENGLFLLYPIIAGIAIDAIVSGQTMLGLIYALLVFVGWCLGSLRRRVDTIVFTKIYAKLAHKVIMSEKIANKDDSTIIARANLSRELVDFFELHFPVFFTSVISMLGSAFMLLFVEFYLGIVSFALLFLLGFFAPKYIAKNEHLYLKLNNQIEKEAFRISIGDESVLKRHYDLLSMIRIKISNREATSFFIIGLVGALLVGVAIVLLSLNKASAGHIYSVLTYLWIMLNSLDDAPRLAQEFSKLKDISKRVNVELSKDI